MPPSGRWSSRWIAAGPLGLSRKDVVQLHEAMMRLIAATRAVPVP